jgi:hypothetical protein
VTVERVVLAYSGGLDTAAIPWLKEHHHAEIVALSKSSPDASAQSRSGIILLAKH